MARPPELRRRIRRRRIVAAVLFLAAVAAAAGVSIAAVSGGHRRPAPAPRQAGPPRPFRIVFPEGFTRAAMAVRVRDVARIADGEHRGRIRLNMAAYLNASTAAVVSCFGPRPQRDLEGFLFPATYDFVADTTARRLVLDQIEAFCRDWGGVELAYARTRNLTPYDVLKIASMVEEEAAAPADRAKIAAVIYNRLRDRIPLGIDATLRFGLHIPPTQSITEAELASDNPYNTRRRLGLPPTPIGNPGLASIEAAAHPSRLGYLYYVRIPGTVRHAFFANAAAYEAYLAAHGYGPHP
jgi:uncharacterized YceG family protein